MTPQTPQPPNLQIRDDEISEIIKYLGLTTMSSTNSVSHSMKIAEVSHKIDFMDLVEKLEAGVSTNFVDSNRDEFLNTALAKVRDFLFFLKETWVLQNDQSAYDTTFDPVLSESEIMAILDFIDLDKSGTLELNELANAFRVSRRFNVGQMLVDGCKNALIQCLPYIRANQLKMSEWLNVFDPAKSGFVSRTSMYQAFQTCGLSDREVEVAIMCLDAGEVDSVPTDVIFPAFGKAASTIKKREKEEKKRQALRDKKAELIATMNSSKRERKNAFSKVSEVNGGREY